MAHKKRGYMGVIGKGRNASNIVNIPLERLKIGLTGRELLDIAEKERSLNPVRYGGTPLVGRRSDLYSKSLIFEAISYSSDFSSISAFRLALTLYKRNKKFYVLQLVSSFIFL